MGERVDEGVCTVVNNPRSTTGARETGVGEVGRHCLDA